MIIKKREQWSSRTGFILATVGSAVGLGNIWRFPTIVGQEGGGAFLLLFLAAVLLIGLPSIIGELALGRRAQRSAVGAFRIFRPGRDWWPAGAVTVLAGVFTLSFYSVVAGWSLIYTLAMAGGRLSGLDAAGLETVFASYISRPFLPLLSHALFMGLTIGIVASGIKKGIERWGKILMPGILLILLLLMVRALTLPGAAAGVKWFLSPDWGKINFRTFLLALGQVFFSFSLGMGAVLTYGSYLGPEENIPQSALVISLSDVVIALIAGFTVIPAVFAFNLKPQIGPGLVFITLPAVFNTIPAGRWFGTAFFLMLTFAALTSSIALLETPVTFLRDETGRRRGPAAIGAGIIIFLLGIPSALSWSLLSGLRLGTRSFFDFIDFLSAGVLLPLGGLLTTLFLGWIWGVASAVREVEKGAGRFRPAGAWSFLIKYLAPIAIGIIMITGLLPVID